MSCAVSRKATKEDYLLLERRANEFVDRHGLKSEIEKIRDTQPEMSTYSALEDLLWTDYFPEQAYYRRLWTPIFRRATGTKGHYIAWGNICSSRGQ